jgi:exodeoxyribonuclease V alpha subunit
LLFVGDHQQLPSVGVGAVMRDIMRSEVVATVKLTTIYRQEGSGGMEIAECSKLICDGKMPVDIRGKPGTHGLNIHHYHGNWVEAGIVKEAVNIAVAHERKSESVLLMGNNRAIIAKANNAMQASLNPRAPGKAEAEGSPLRVYLKTGSNPEKLDRTWRVDDKVVYCKNEVLEFEDESGAERSERMVNGDRGRIVRIVRNRLNILFEPQKLVWVPTCTRKLHHAWALTVWKAQGSEADRVVFALASNWQASRELLNTAVTRAKIGADVFASPRDLRLSVDKQLLLKRRTYVHAHIASVAERAAKRQKTG